MDIKPLNFYKRIQIMSVKGVTKAPPMDELELTERKRAEDAHPESENLYRNLFENTSEGIYQSKPEGTYITVNPAFARMHGYDSPEAMIKEATDFAEQRYVHPEDRREIKHLLMTTGVVRGYEAECSRRDGRLIWISLNARTIRDPEGHIICFEGATRDITLRKLAEQKLQEQLAFLQTLLDAIPSPIFYKDTKGIYLGCNKAFAEFNGLSKKEIIGKSVYEVWKKDLADQYYRADTELLKNPGFQTYEASMMHTDGTAHPVIFYKATFNNKDGAVGGLIGSFIDIEKRKKAEEALVIEKKQLAETNIALRVLLQNREEDQKEIERQILTNIQKLVLPYMEKLRSLKLSGVQEDYLDMACNNLQQVTSPFLQNLAACFVDFTPREIHVAHMIREGKTSKEIAGIFNSSIRSVEFHRDNIRKKLGLNRKKSNLRTFLMHLSK
jgi:PAS domain S-box-containing protein